MDARPKTPCLKLSWLRSHCFLSIRKQYPTSGEGITADYGAGAVTIILEGLLLGRLDWAACTCRPGFGKVTRELIAQTPEYASVSHDQSTQQLPSNPNTMANKTQQELNFTLRSRHARSASPQQQIGNRWLIPHQAMARAQAAMGILTPHNSLASLASSMRSEEQAGLSLDKQLPGRTISDHEGFDPQPVSLCRQSEDIQWKSIGRQTEEVRRKSVGSPVSPASSVDNSLRSDAGSMHSLSHLAQFPGSRGGDGQPRPPHGSAMERP